MALRCGSRVELWCRPQHSMFGLCSCCWRLHLGVCRTKPTPEKSGFRKLALAPIATFRQSRLSGFEHLDQYSRKRVAKRLKLPPDESQLEIGSFSSCRDCVAVDSCGLLASGNVWSRYFLPGGNTFGPSRLLFRISSDDQFLLLWRPDVFSVDTIFLREGN